MAVVKADTETVKVMVRVRPMSQKEFDEGNYSLISPLKLNFFHFNSFKN